MSPSVLLQTKPGSMLTDIITLLDSYFTAFPWTYMHTTGNSLHNFVSLVFGR